MISFQLKLHILFLVPITVVFAVNSIALYIAESPVLLALNVVVYMSVVSISLLFLGNFCDKLHKNLKQLAEGLETVNYSANLLKEEVIPEESKPEIERDGIYSQLKHVLMLCGDRARTAGAEKKGYLLVARELAAICAEMGSHATQAQDVTTNHTNMVYFVSDCISKNTDRLSVQLNSLGVDTCPKKNKKKVHKKPLPDESPLKAGSLRHSIRLAEKRLAA